MIRKLFLNNRPMSVHSTPCEAVTHIYMQAPLLQSVQLCFLRLNKLFVIFRFMETKEETEIWLIKVGNCIKILQMLCFVVLLVAYLSLYISS